jgi:hypothetical protein
MERQIYDIAMTYRLSQSTGVVKNCYNAERRDQANDFGSGDRLGDCVLEFLAID